MEKESENFESAGPKTETTEVTNGEPKVTSPSLEEWQEWLKKFELLLKESENQKDLYLRARAELENYKKRLSREREEMRFQLMGLIFDPLLTIIENFSLGLKNAEANKIDKEVLEGFKMVLQQLHQYLKDFSVEAIDTTTAFDPRFHEAISAIHDPKAVEGSILNVVRTGYRMGDRVLRPASVIVSKGPEVLPS